MSQSVFSSRLGAEQWRAGGDAYNAMLEQRGSGRGLVHICARSHWPPWELEL